MLGTEESRRATRELADAERDPQHWITRVQAAREASWRLWQGAVDAGDVGHLAPYLLGNLKAELDWLEALTRELDRYVAEVGELSTPARHTLPSATRDEVLELGPRSVGDLEVVDTAA